MVTIVKNISLLGSTGSIGTQTLDVVRRNDDINVVALAAGIRIKELEAQVREFKPQLVCVGKEELAEELKIMLSDMDVKIVSGESGLIEAATLESADIVLTAVVGMMGIVPTIEAIKAHKDIALANKETLVTAGHIIMKLAKECGVNIYPVDSEHSAIFQSLNGEYHKEVSKILLTASGGPFRGRKRSELENVTLEDALKHPNWSMGRKITIDSSTMANKGLEVMEAQWLFDVPADKVQVVIQPQSIIHSMVEFVDGGIMAQLGSPDMRLPIQYALTYPHRRTLNTERVDFFKLGQITFEEPDFETFKALKLAYDAAGTGGNIPTAFNAANELAVAKFLDRKIKYLDIPEIIQYAMEETRLVENPSVEQILETEKNAYELIESRW
jgi:1-deoxy-D-xylulose-5-phosphate reductoisomerase